MGAIPILLMAAITAGRPVSLRPVRGKTSLVAPHAAGNFTLNASPASISFNASNPQTSPVVAGSSTSSITWSILSGGDTWELTVQAASPSFTNCPFVPISAVTVTCASASVGSFGGSAACAGAFPLSTTPTRVAGGNEGVVALNYSVTLNFTLADSWKYIAEISPACSLSLTYKADVR
jgi:hypothetical protein